MISGPIHAIANHGRLVARHTTKPSPDDALQLVASSTKLASDLETIGSAQEKLGRLLEATRSAQVKLEIKLERQEVLLEGVKSSQEKQDVKINSARLAQEKMETRLAVVETKLAATEASQQQFKDELQKKDDIWRATVSSAHIPQFEDIKSTQKAQHVLLNKVDACQEAQQGQLTGMSMQLVNVEASLKKLAEEYVISRDEDDTNCSG
jgi:hypothetical protein